MADGSVSRWISQLKNGEHEAAQALWERYHARLLGLARQRLAQSNRGHADEEDAVQVAFKCFFEGVIFGRFPNLSDRDDLWRLLVVITTRKSIDHVRREQRNGSGHVTLSVASTISIKRGEDDLENLVCREPTADMALELIEGYETLLARLDDPQLKRIAVWKLEGYNNEEIAAKLGCSRRTVIRKLETIRLIWSNDFDP